MSLRIVSGGPPSTGMRESWPGGEKPVPLGYNKFRNQGLSFGYDIWNSHFPSGVSGVSLGIVSKLVAMGIAEDSSIRCRKIPQRPFRLEPKITAAPSLLHPVGKFKPSS